MDQVAEDQILSIAGTGRIRGQQVVIVAVAAAKQCCTFIELQSDPAPKPQ
jgi:hypothetical protein